MNTSKYVKERLIRSHTKFKRPPRNYSIVPATVPNFANNTIYIDKKGQKINSDRAWGYLFNLVPTVLAWRRIDYYTIVVLTIDYKNVDPEALRLLSLVEEKLHCLNASIVYFDVPSVMKTRLSQVLRLLPGELDMVEPDDFVVTSDSDLWPIDPRRYYVSVNKTIRITNAMCCGSLGHNGKRYKHYPLSTITMTGRMWKYLLPGNIVGKYNGSYTLQNIEPFLKRLEKFAGTSNIYTWQHAGKGFWLDQTFYSVHIGEYLEKHGKSQFEHARLNECARINVPKWHEIDKRKCFSDAHIFKVYPWKNETWTQIKRLAVKVFDEESNKFLDDFREKFEGLFMMAYDKLKKGVNAYPKGDFYSRDVGKAKVFKKKE